MNEGSNGEAFGDEVWGDAHGEVSVGRCERLDLEPWEKRPDRYTTIHYIRPDPEPCRRRLWPTEAAAHYLHALIRRADVDGQRAIWSGCLTSGLTRCLTSCLTGCLTGFLTSARVCAHASLHACHSRNHHRAARDLEWLSNEFSNDFSNECWCVCVCLCA